MKMKTTYVTVLFLLSGILGFSGCGNQDPADDPVVGDSTHAHGEIVTGPDDHILVTPDEIEWRDGPASLNEGAQYAVLEGDPSETGMFAMRLKLPDGFDILPHVHPGVERVTVLSGRFFLGTGDVFDRGRVTELPAGSFTSMPPGMEHYAFTVGETILQLTSIGPWDIRYINPEHDPRLEDPMAEN